MTKRVKNLILVVLSAGLLACLAFLCLLPTNKVVFADSYTTEELGDGNFRFEEGASLQFETDEGENITTRLGFKLFLDNPKFENLKDFARVNRYALDRMKNIYKHTFTVYRCNGDGSTSTPLMRVLILFDTLNKGTSDVYLRRWVAVKNLSYYNEKIEFITPQEEGSNPSDTYKDADVYDYIIENGYTLSDIPDVLDGSRFPNEKGLNWGGGITQKYIRLSINALSEYTSYYVRFDYEYQHCIKGGLLVFGGGDYETTKGTVESSVRSVYQILKNMDETDGLETVLGEYMGYNETIVSHARLIVDSMAKKEVTITYLKRIGKTPFAEKKEVKITVPVVDDQIKIDDVYAALNVSTLNCLDSNCNEFRYDANTGKYEAYYYKNVWLRSITTDGNYVDYFLDINQSFEDYYYQFVTASVFSEDLYEWVFSTQLLSKYPALSGYSQDDIYGYFGFVTVPQTYSANSIFVEMFNIETSKVGTIQTFKFEENLTFEAYEKLLTDYKYGWLEKAWNGIAGFVAGSKYPANYYMFFSEPGTKDAFIGEGGQEDAIEPDSAIGESVDKVVDGFKDKVDDVLQIGNNFWRTITSPFKTKGGAIAIVSIIAVAAVVIVIVKYNSKGAKPKKRK